MEDDIDDLLNEVEHKFCATGRQKSAKKDGSVSDSRKTSNATTSSVSRSVATPARTTVQADTVDKVREVMYCGDDHT